MLIAAAVHAEDISRDGRRLVGESGVTGGVVVQIGADGGKEVAGLLAGDQYLVQVLETDAGKIAKTRDELRAGGLYGKISVRDFDGKTLPYADNVVNLILVSRGACRVSGEEIARVLAPRGVLLTKAPLASTSRNLKRCEPPQGLKGWSMCSKPVPVEIDDWTHFLHGPDNNAVANDTRAGMPRSIQWVADPMWMRSHEQMASVSALVSAKGRVFYVEDLAPRVSIRYMADWKLTCRDAFNGKLLWQRDVGQWSDHLRHFRAGPVHLPRRLVAVGDKIYVTLAIDAPVSVLDAVTGKTLQTLEGTERTDEIIVDGDVAYLVVGTSEVFRMGSGDSFYERGGRQGVRCPQERRSAMLEVMGIRAKTEDGQEGVHPRLKPEI